MGGPLRGFLIGRRDFPAVCLGGVGVVCLWVVGGACGHARSATIPSRLHAGDRMLYRMEYRGKVTAQAAGPLQDAAHARQLSVALSCTVRVQVERIGPAGSVHLLARVEAAEASTQSDSSTPEMEQWAASYRSLQGKSFRVTLDAQGRPFDLAQVGAENQADPFALGLMHWLGGILWAGGGIGPQARVGQKWVAETPLEGIPLAGLLWRSESVVRAVEPCRSAVTGALEPCARIGTHLATLRRAAGSDPTPPLYRQQGLQTSGRWTVEGDSVSLVSLVTGLLQTSTAIEQQTIDLLIRHVRSGTALRYRAQTEGRSELRLVGWRPAGQ